jgi:hypothetical protein
VDHRQDRPPAAVAVGSAVVLQIVQSVGRGRLRLANVPRPTISATEVLVAPSASVLSPGTERAVRDLARTNLLGKAAARPDLVRQVRRRLVSAGPASTLRSVRDRLGEEMPLGYSSAGTVLEVGEAVAGLAPGDRVAAAGAGHGELQVVSGLLAAPVPAGVDLADAAFAAVGSVALHALRLGEVGPGSRVVVVGLGLVGQLAVRLAVAAGAEVAGIDARSDRLERATAGGAALVLVEDGDTTTDQVLAWSRGRGADAVVVAAASSSSDPMHRAAAVARDRAHVVVVGDVGLDLDRRPLYLKELRVVVARSYGPGRYDPSYEDLAVDHPVGHVPWTAGRNLEAFLDLLASNRLRVDDLVTHDVPFAQAADAYALLDDASSAALGVRLRYEGVDGSTTPAPPSSTAPTPPTGDRLGIVGAGRYVTATLLPALQAAGFERPAAICSAGGSAARVAEGDAVDRAVASLADLLADPEVGTVVVATPHAEHAEQAADALRAGRHVWCEKPLALDQEQLERVRSAWQAGDRELLVGFNRRHAPTVRAAVAHLQPRTGPLVITYRVATPPLPEDHWYHDRRQGGRLLGEVCHAVDTCAALVGSTVRLVTAVGGGDHEALLLDHLVVSLAYDDGSVAAITWTPGGHPSTTKERIEAHGGGRSAVIDDFASIALDGGRAQRSRQDKGHEAMARAFRAALRSGEPWDTEAALASTEATLAAAEALLSGSGVTPESGGPVPPRP